MQPGASQKPLPVEARERGACRKCAAITQVIGQAARDHWICRDCYYRHGTSFRALTLSQPWATMVAHGVNRIETRSWALAYRGPIAIHAATAIPSEVQHLQRDPIYRDALARCGITTWTQLPLGMVVGTADVDDVLPIDLLYAAPDGLEADLGNFEHGRWAFHLSHTRAIRPQPARGFLGLWDWRPIAPIGYLAERPVRALADPPAAYAASRTA